MKWDAVSHGNSFQIYPERGRRCIMFNFLIGAGIGATCLLFYSFLVTRAVKKQLDEIFMGFKVIRTETESEGEEKKEEGEGN
jgi:hypothetical protein